MVFEVAELTNRAACREVADPKAGDTTNDTFRTQVFDEVTEKYCVCTICVPAVGITRDARCVRMNRETGRAEPYSIRTFRQVTEVNLIAPILWAIQMVVRIAEDRWKRGLKRWEPEESVQGAIIFIGSVSSAATRGRFPTPRRKPDWKAPRPRS